VAENFAADAGFAGFFVSHDALGSGENRDSQSAKNLIDFFLTGIKSSTGFGNSFDSFKDMGVLFTILQENLQIEFILKL
jgi:hypothetical protein